MPTLKSVVVTGATGLLGAAVVKKLLAEAESKITVIARAKKTKSAVERMQQSLQLAVLPPSLTVIDGDLTLPTFGIAASHYKQLLASTTHFVHSAADIRLVSVRERHLAESHAMTNAVLEFSHASTVLQNVAYVSSVGVGGKRQTALPESQTDKPGSFHTAYEEAKYLAEQRVLEEMPKGLKYTIHRPSMIIPTDPSNAVTAFEIIVAAISGVLGAGTTPDWGKLSLDAVPVEYVSNVIHWALSQAEPPKFLHSCYGPLKAPTIDSLAETIGKQAESTIGKKPQKINLTEYEKLVAAIQDKTDCLKAFRAGILAILPYIETAPVFCPSAHEVALSAVGISLADSGYAIPVALKFQLQSFFSRVLTSI